MTSAVVSCNSPYDEGGLGKLLSAVVEQERSKGTLREYYCLVGRPGDSAARVVDLGRHRWLTRGLLRFAAHGWRDFAACELFDRAVATRLSGAEEVIGVAGRALETFRRARQLRTRSLVLEAPNSDVGHLQRQQRLAEAASGIERGWVTPLHARKMRLECSVADRIVVSSEYVRRSFLEAGIPDRRVTRRVQPVSARFVPPLKRPPHDRFTVVYVGRLDIVKGVTVLIEAFKRFQRVDAALVIVGRAASRAMDSFISRACRADPRITLRPGDPLPELHCADVLVHAAFEDGLGLAPLEALACGVPVIVTEDTGMKEYVESGRNGFVVRTADVDAIVDRLNWIADHPLRGTFAPMPATPVGATR